MRFWKPLVIILAALALFSGCSRYMRVGYENIEETNSVEITLNSGGKVYGSIIKSEPYQLTLLNREGRKAMIAKDNIRTIKRLPPVYDDFGRGISEEEIAGHKSNKNAVIYGVGGGSLSLVASFFAGSMLAGENSDNGGTVLAATVGVGGGLGTLLFVRAGMAKDRKDAVEEIRQERISIRIDQKKSTAGQEDKDMDQLIQDEKAKQEKLRKEREELLKKMKNK